MLRGDREISEKVAFRLRGAELARERVRDKKSGLCESPEVERNQKVSVSSKKHLRFFFWGPQAVNKEQRLL